MSYALPHPSRSLAVPLAALALGAAGGTTAALIIADSDTIIRNPAPAAEVRLPSSGAMPVPERVSPAPPVAKSSPAPAPERVAPAPTVSVTKSTVVPAPERVSPAPTVSSVTKSTSSRRPSASRPRRRRRHRSPAPPVTARSPCPSASAARGLARPRSP